GKVHLVRAQEMGAHVVEPGELLEVLFEDVGHHESGSSLFTGGGTRIVRREDRPWRVVSSARSAAGASASAKVADGPPSPLRTTSSRSGSQVRMARPASSSSRASGTLRTNSTGT